MSDEYTFEGDELQKLQAHAREQLEALRPAEGTLALSSVPTPYAVHCPEHEQQFLTEDEYGRQLCRPDNRWTCPVCGRVSMWDDDNYESYLDEGP